MYKKFSDKKVYLIVSGILLLFTLSSCSKDKIPESNLIVKDNLIYKKGSDVPFTGKERAWVDNQIIEYEVVNGIKHGEFKIYYQDETPAMIGQLDSNKNVGKWQYFYQTGKIESEGYFDNDLPEGRWVWYYPSGQVSEEGSFHKGFRVGLWMQYDENGEVIKEYKFEESDSVTAGIGDKFRDVKKFEL